jgi:hypothetical protein
MLEERKALPLAFSVKNCFVFKDAHNIRKNGKIRGSIVVIMHIRKSENVDNGSYKFRF